MKPGNHKTFTLHLPAPCSIRWDISNKAIIVIAENETQYIFDYKNRELIKKDGDNVMRRKAIL